MMRMTCLQLGQSVNSPLCYTQRRGLASTYIHIPSIHPQLTTNSNKTDPMVGHGKHFGRAVNAVTNMKALITGGLDRMTRIGAGESLEEMTRG